MSRKLRALDLFCGAGGAGRGLIQAGFDVVGVDIEPQPRYPGEFIQGDVFKLVEAVKGRIDFVWASPPCQAHTVLKHAPGNKKHIDLIPATRRLLKRLDLPYVIENVPGAPLENPITLCGSMFGLHAMTRAYDMFELRRHRVFETSFKVEPPKCEHRYGVLGVYGGHVRVRAASKGGRGTVDLPGDDRPKLAAKLMDMEDAGLTMNELSQAIPPAYSKYLAEQWLKGRGNR